MSENNRSNSIRGILQEEQNLLSSVQDLLHTHNNERSDTLLDLLQHVMCVRLGPAVSMRSTYVVMLPSIGVEEDKEKAERDAKRAMENMARMHNRGHARGSHIMHSSESRTANLGVSTEEGGTCLESKYIAIAGTTIADIVCSSCTSTCSGDTYQTTACTSSSNRVCTSNGF